MDVTEDPAGGVPGGIVGGGTGAYAGAEVSFTGGAFATIAADSLLNPSVMAWTTLSLPSRISTMQGLEPFLASCLSSQYFVTDALEAGVCLTLGTAHLPFQVLE